MALINFGANISSLVAQRHLGEATQKNSEISERLSSGLRVNSASDDPASLAVLAGLNASSKIYSQGIRNLNDGISLISIADSAISALTDITTRLSELANQASNGSYSNTQRSALDAEAQALSKEYTRITQSTKFNGTSLLNGSLASGLQLQAGSGTEGTISSTLGGAIGTGTFTNSQTLNYGYTVIQDVLLGDLDNDGDLDLVANADGANQVSLNNGNGTLSGATYYSTDTTAGFKGYLVDLNNDGNLDLISAGIRTSNTLVATVRIGNGNGTFGTSASFVLGSATGISGFAIGDVDNDGNLDAVTLANTPARIFITKGNGDGTFQASTSIAAGNGYANTNTLQLSDINSDGLLDIVSAVSGGISVNLGTGGGSFGSTVTNIYGGITGAYSLSMGDIDGDGKIDAVAAFEGGIILALRSAGNGTFSIAQSYYNSAETYETNLSDVNGDGILDIIQLQNSATNTVIIKTGVGNGTFNAATSFNYSTNPRGLALGDLNADGVNDLVLGAYNNVSVPVFLANTQSGTNPLLNFSLKTKSEARYAQSLFSQKLNQLTAQRGQIGAFQSRVSTAANTLTNIRDQYMTASSRIGDADIAADSAEYVRTQILQNAATAVLAQANQSSKISLNLLGISS